MMSYSPFLPLIVALYNGLVCLSGVAVVADDVVGGLASPTQLFQGQLLLILELHVFSTFNEADQGVGFGLEGLLNWVFIAFKDKNVLVDRSILSGLNGDDDEETKLLSESVLLASSAESLNTEVADKCVDVASRNGHSHEARCEVVLLEIADKDAVEAEGKASLNVEFGMI